MIAGRSGPLAERLLRHVGLLRSVRSAQPSRARIEREVSAVGDSPFPAWSLAVRAVSSLATGRPNAVAIAIVRSGTQRMTGRQLHRQRASLPLPVSVRDLASFARPVAPSADPVLQRIVAQAELSARTYPHDPAVQLAFMQALYRTNSFARIVEHASSGRFAMDQRCAELYNAARAKLEASMAGSGASQPQPQPPSSSSPMGTGMYSPHPMAPPLHPWAASPIPGPYGGQYQYPGAMHQHPYGGGAPGPVSFASPEMHAQSLSPAAGMMWSPSSSSSSMPGGAPSYSTGAEPRLGSDERPIAVRQVPGPMSFWDKVSLFMRFLMGAFLLYSLFNFQRQMSGAGGKGGITDMLGGGAAQVEEAEVPETRFVDVRGVDEAKRELQDVVEYLRDPDKFSRLGAKLPKGVLLTGPPGTGKTLLARAVAGEAGVKFYNKSASEFEEMLVGLGARRVRDLFAAAKKNAPAIIFIDEIDAMGSKRGRMSIGTGSERQTLNQLLACMDGFTKSDNVVVIAATNNPEILDPALVRPGRFDASVSVTLPDIKGRREILELYLSKVPVAPDVDPGILAAATPGMAGAALANMVNIAAIEAAKRGSPLVTLQDLEEARDKSWMGPALRSRVRTTEELRLTAYHEGGHTIAGLLTKAAQELHKVTILARGGAGGVTFFLSDDSNMLTREQLLARLDVAMGGRVAEELVFGKERVTTGAGSDMHSASRIARAYVKTYSMSELGLTTFDNSEDGRASSTVKARIDSEVEKLLQASYARVTRLLTDNRAALDRLADALMEHETLTADECRRVMAGEKLPSPAELAKLRARLLAEKASPPGGASSPSSPSKGAKPGGSAPAAVKAPQAAPPAKKVPVPVPTPAPKPAPAPTPAPAPAPGVEDGDVQEIPPPSKDPEPNPAPAATASARKRWV